LFFSESLVGLAFFDSQVDLDTMRAMVANLDLLKTASGVKRVNASGADFSRLEKFVTSRTNDLFNLLSITGTDRGSKGLLVEGPENMGGRSILPEIAGECSKDESSQ